MPGIFCLEITGDELTSLNNESGGHRIQRVPPTERKGRVHTSTVTVAVINLDKKANPNFSKRSSSDFKIEWFSGTGAGGQRRNKKQCSARIVHIPTGISESAQTRSRENSERLAMDKLIMRLDVMSSCEYVNDIAYERKEKVGSGMRGDKVRTYRFQDDIVTNHLNGAKASVSKIMEGYFELLY